MKSHKLADVTLVYNDKTKFKVHKFVLSACSPVFQSIIDDLPNKGDSFIYLRGVEHDALRAILDFIYLGQAKVDADKVNDFMKLASDLQIKGLRSELSNKKQTKISGFKDISYVKDLSYVSEGIDQTPTCEKVKPHNPKGGSSNVKAIDRRSNFENCERDSYQRLDCDYEARKKDNFEIHNKSQHMSNIVVCKTEERTPYQLTQSRSDHEDLLMSVSL